MKVLITGATGLIGKELVRTLLTNDIEINYLTTSRDKIVDTDTYNGFYWNPKEGVVDSCSLEGVDAIIHLAGATVSKKWTPAYKEEILQSRMLSAQLLYNLLKNHPGHTVKNFISASGISIYPSDFDKLYDEKFEGVDNTFLGEVVEEWESGVNHFTSLGINVAKIRIGLVLANNGGALDAISKPVKMGVGASIGSGKQWVSWIHISDLTSIFLKILTEKREGIYNAVAPNPVTNKQLTKAIARVLRKPLWLPNIPEFVMKILLGERSTLVLSSQKVSCKKLLKSSYQFQFNNIEYALNDLLVEQK
ncbi:MAG: TIGR01777 family protein [Flavobacteriales bacterium CG_4_9_14_3_um_filter_40_17]|nr:MAG: TIGR01777 family protein [Flavobacteriales bacterium CG_4_9_14_3_um_filter_40_17]